MTPADGRATYAWMLSALIFAASVMNYMDRAVLGVLMQQVRRELSMSNTDYGIAVNMFLCAYAVFYILGGRLADRFGYRRTIAISLTFWSLMGAAHAFVRGLGSLCVARGLLGVGEGSFYPAAIRGITEWFSTEQRAKAIGLLLAGLSVGSLLTPPLAAWISIHHGWRSAFFVIGAAGLLLLPAWQILHRSIRRTYGCEQRPLQPAETAEPDTATPLRFVLLNRKYWSAVFARALSDSAWYFYLFWMPGYFQAVRGFDAAMVGKYLWMPYLAACGGALGGAWVASGLMRRGMPMDRARKTVLLASAAGSAAGALAFLPGAAAAVMLVCLALFAHTSYATNIHTVITDISPPAHTAVLYGISGATGTVMGALSQPVIGWIVDVRGYTPAFLAAGSCYVLAAVLLLVGVGRIERIVAHAGAAVSQS